MSTDDKVERAQAIVAGFEAGKLTEAEARQELLALGEDLDMVAEMLSIADGTDDVVEVD